VTALIALTFLVQTARAKLPPQVFLRQQARAEEQISIRITSVTVTPTGDREAVVAEATVQAVDHSKSGLKQGESITINYTRLIPKKPVPGRTPTGANRSGPYLSKGESTCAFLNKRPDGTYALGASNRSFPAICPSPKTLEPHKPAPEDGDRDNHP
jgi:hypothetical protein